MTNSRRCSRSTGSGCAATCWKTISLDVWRGVGLPVGLGWPAGEPPDHVGALEHALVRLESWVDGRGGMPRQRQARPKLPPRAGSVTRPRAGARQAPQRRARRA